MYDGRGLPLSLIDAVFIEHEVAIQDEEPMRPRLKGLVLALSLISVPVGATLHQGTEIGAREYRVLRDAFKRGTPAYRAAIADAMRSGEVSRWEYRRLHALFPDDGSGRLENDDATNVREERLVLAAMTRQVKAPEKRAERRENKGGFVGIGGHNAHTAEDT